MMMPANYSAISENEMTYVSGGAVALEDILAPKLTVENWQNFNKNMVTIIGNTFVGDYVKNTVGVLFGGAYTPGKLATTWWNNTVSGAYNSGYNATSAGAHNKSRGGDALSVANGVLNVGLRMLGSAAAIYNLATGTSKNGASGQLLFSISTADAQ